MTQTAINALCSLFASVPKDSGEFRRKAVILCEFAGGVSDEVLHRAGLTETDALWEYNVLAYKCDPPMLELPDVGIALALVNVSTSLTATSEPTEAHWLVFCTEKVLDWNQKTDKPNRVMNYEEAARFVVFWLAEKIIQICRKNEWDRIKQLPDLFDQLASFFAPAQTYSSGSVLKQKLGLPYDPENLLLTLADLRDIMPIRLYNALSTAVNKGRVQRRSGDDPFQSRSVLFSDRLGYIVTLHRDDLCHLPYFGRKCLVDLEKILKGMNLSTGMRLPQEVQDWYESQIG